ncbi:BTB/POZ domain-containing protein 6-A-like [Branchiostoma floridae]|uniref:BTB/POZ domain-containing protein 6-A-like n=2 Tax=Branchiostoma floridae TaxID=7739 RepID=A0A9J7LLH1_BRAFL|nr:BTB/POZ domain-containing protein 6-A-like [Branchiostoma floridae]
MGSESTEREREAVGDHREFVASFECFYNSSDLSDVVLVVGKDRYHAHKFMLARLSDVFRTMLTGEHWTDSSKEEIQLKESCECESVFGDFLRFFYCGRVNLDIETTLPLLFLADKYDVKPVREVCDKYMTGQVMKGNVRAALLWLHYAKVYSLTELETQCIEVLSLRMTKAMKTPEWLNLDLPYVIELLQNSSLVVDEEFVLFQALQDWLLAECRADKVEDYLPKVMSQEWCTFLGLQLSDIRKYPNNVNAISLDGPIPVEAMLNVVHWNMAVHLYAVSGAKPTRIYPGPNTVLPLPQVSPPETAECLSIKVTPLKLATFDRDVQLSLVLYDKDMNVARVIRNNFLVKGVPGANNFGGAQPGGFRFSPPIIPTQSSFVIEHIFDQKDLGQDSMYIKDGFLHIAIIIKPRLMGTGSSEGEASGTG